MFTIRHLAEFQRMSLRMDITFLEGVLMKELDSHTCLVMMETWSTLDLTIELVTRMVLIAKDTLQLVQGVIMGTVTIFRLVQWYWNSRTLKLKIGKLMLAEILLLQVRPTLPSDSISLLVRLRSVTSQILLIRW